MHNTDEEHSKANMFAMQEGTPLEVVTEPQYAALKILEKLVGDNEEGLRTLRKKIVMSVAYHNTHLIDIGLIDNAEHSLIQVAELLEFLEDIEIYCDDV